MPHLTYILSLCLSLLAAEPQVATGTVIAVRDADTIVVRFTDWTFAVRPYLVDAPEAAGARWPEQPYQREARQFTEQFLLDQQATVTLQNFSFDRMVATVTVDGRDWGQSLVAAGLAWYDDRYGVNSSLAAAEDAARQQRRGLWAAEQPIRPSAWRERGKKNRNAHSLPIRLYQAEPQWWWWTPQPCLQREFSVPTDPWHQPPRLYSPDGFYVG